MAHVLRLVLLGGAVLALAGCGSRMPIVNPDPRSHQEYAGDREVCVRQHTFAAAGEAAGRCLHCELYVLCMEKQMWRMDAASAPADTGLSCCRGTARASS